ncbi:hypothetical protein Vretimale_6202 [Volvox reticuliferus]|uniref:TPX2 C-terminal domain-containing protein n=1 Tax=Volvox reticuliferus TaxID=1737510 RepID=A0A8J4CCY3_9CHLO|nr:hypothetical protein Vretifemale_7994 [Volvox reticuliferus]GIM01367.1 hypothetical protein Vretimale_6202 [Volvox reticuliferus]
MEFDWRYECDAPRYRDFEQKSTGSVNSDWFDTHEEYASEHIAGGALADDRILGDISNTVEAQAENVVGDAEAKPIETKKKKNIVTSWGEDAKKRKAEDGATGQRAVKAIKRNGSTVAPQPGGPALAAKARSRRSRAAAAEGRHELSKERRDLMVVKVSMKRTGKARSTKMPRVFKPMLSTRKLTVPDDVELHTDKRAAAHAKDQVVGHHDEASDGDTEDNGDKSPYKPLVLRVKEFDKTPSRFKRKPDDPPPSKPLTITEAKEPQLLTSARVRPSIYKPREMVEAEEMAQIPTFRASTLNPLILSTSGQLGVPKVDKRGPTEPRPFIFVTDDRAEARAARLAKQQEQEPGKRGQSERQTVSDSEGHEKIDKSQSAKLRRSVACHSMELVVPRSPLLRTKFRARETKIDEQRYEFHARPVPKYLSLPSLELPKGFGEAAPAPTQPEPFRLATEERGARHRDMLVAKLAEEERAAQRARLPRAHGLPLSTDMPILPPKPEPRALTVPEPFNLISEVRHVKCEEQKRRLLEEEEARKRAEAEFKARPMWRGVPYRVHDADVPLTVPEPVNLRTSVRAVVREEFNKHIEEKWKENEAVKQAEEEEARLREEEMRRQARKAAVFRAMPMPDLSAPPAVKVAVPVKPLTQPKSPALATKRRRVKKSEGDA